MIIRTVLVVAFLAALWALGIIHLEDLPLGSREFQTSGVAVIIYLFWSAAEGNLRRGSSGTPYLVFYAVLLVSALDSFLLELTSGILPFPVRWLGLALFATGCALRLAAFRRRSVPQLRTGRILQLLGLPVALGSVAGLVLGAAAGIPGSAGEELPEEDDPEEDQPL